MTSLWLVGFAAWLRRRRNAVRRRRSRSLWGREGRGHRAKLGRISRGEPAGDCLPLKKERQMTIKVLMHAHFGPRKTASLLGL